MVFNSYEAVWIWGGEDRGWESPHMAVEADEINFSLQH